tara:strand:+ start:33 stop:449 length:417 start_codon:yes stop_codon:yes gene_type:complete
MKLKMAQLRRIIRESIKDLFVTDPDYTYQDGFTSRHYSADTMFYKDLSGNIKKARQELLPLLSQGAEVLPTHHNRSRMSGDLQVYIPNCTQEDEMVMADYGFKEASRYDIHKAYRKQTGKLFVRTVSGASNYASFMDS